MSETAELVAVPETHPARKVACPKCGAAPGQRCRGVSAWPHAARVRALMKALLKLADTPGME